MMRFILSLLIITIFMQETKAAVNSEHPGLKAWDCELGRALHSAQHSVLKDPALKGRVSPPRDELHQCLVEIYGLEDAPCAMILEKLSDPCNDPKQQSLIDAFISQSKKTVHESAIQQKSIALNGLDALIAAPLSHRVLFENERFRILEDRVAPGETVPFHTHDWDCIMIILQGSRFYAQKAAEPVVEEEWVPLVEFYKGESIPYSFTNIGEKEFQAIAFEIKPFERPEQVSSSLKTSAIY